MDNIKRLTSAMLGMPLVIIILVFGNNYVVDIAFALIAAVSLHEYFDSIKEKAKPIIWIGYVTSVLIAFVHVIPVSQVITLIAIGIPLLILILFLEVILTNMKKNILDISVTFFGICYVILFIMFIPLIHGMENGKFLIWFLLCASWGSDVFAYYIGKNFGKHKFSEISPNKTIEGCVAGVVGSMIFAATFTLVFNLIFKTQFAYLPIIGIVALLSIIGQIGDFAASSIKRYVGIKDFSQIIPGHGGMLDRIDSIIFVAPFAYFLFKMFII